ncbi:MAG: BamA/OMP85 family outer membrane protein [Myxococcaceae bacterium]
MNRRLRRRGALVALLLAACAGKQKPDEPPIRSLKIEGTKQIKAGVIEDHILTTGPSWWPFSATPYFDPIAWQADMRRIERYYQSQGYYQAEVVDDEVRPDDDGVALTVQVSEGKPTIIRHIQFEGLDSLPPDFQQKARRSISLKVGQILTEDGWRNVKREVTSALRALGYAEAEVTGEVFVETTDQTARIRLVCVPGERYRFGNIFVATGPRPSVQVRYIIDQAQGSIRKGDWFSDTALEQAQRRVFRMGVFGAVKVTTGTPDKANATIPVVVDVRESPFHSIRYGGRIGIDPVRQEYRLTAEYVDRNFLGDLRRLTVRGKVGWAFLPAIWNIQQNGSLFDLYTEFEQPRFPGRDFKWVSSVDFYKNLEQAYGYLGTRGRTGIIWQPVSNFRIYPSYNLELDRITGVTNGLSGTAPQLAYGCNLTPTDPVCYVFLSYLEISFEWDNRDDKLEPRNGWLAALGIQQGGGWLGGDYTYVRIFPDLRAYKSWGPFTVAGKLRIGTLLSKDVSPITARFFSGGGTFDRGFGSQRLSPMLAVPNNNALPTNPLVGNVGKPQLQGTYVPVGGNGLWDSSIELRYNVWGNLTIALFLDMGFVSIGSFNWNDVGPMMTYSVGIGLRYKTFIGPIRVDFAYRLNHGGPLPIIPDPTNPILATGNTSCFGLGNANPSYAGYPEGRCALTISIGEAY